MRVWSYLYDAIKNGDTDVSKYHWDLCDIDILFLPVNSMQIGSSEVPSTIAAYIEGQLRQQGVKSEFIH